MDMLATKILFIFCAITLCCLSCEKEDPRSISMPGGQEVDGYFHTGFEYSSFYPCGTSEEWMATGADLGARYHDLHLKLGEKAYAHIYGVLHGPGNYGHLGGYEWHFEVLRVIEMREIREGDCN